VRPKKERQLKPSMSTPKAIIDTKLLVDKLKAFAAEEEKAGRECFMDAEHLVERESVYTNVFFASKPMIENYLTYRDFVFVNKRLARTRFNKTLILFCAVNSEGRSVMLAFALVPKEDEDSMEYAVNQFYKYCDGVYPRVIIIDRNSTLRA